MRKVALRSLRAHKGRVGMTVVAVALGVAFMSGVLVLTDSMEQSFDELFETVYEGTDAVVRSGDTLSSGEFGAPEERGTLDEAVLDDVRGVDSVNLAAGEVEGFAEMFDADGETLGPVFGGPSLMVSVDPEVQDHWDEVSTIDLREGAWPSSDDEVVIDADSFQRSSYELGDEMSVQTETGVAEYSLVGTVGFGSSDSAAGQTLIALTTDAAQEALGQEGQLDSISVQGTDGTSQEQVAEDIQAAVDDGVDVITGEEAIAEAQDDLGEVVDFVTIAFGIFALISLVVGAFVIYNSFAIIVAQRTREMALLRAIGASRRQVRRVVTVEAVATGLVGSAIGLLIGIGLAALFSMIMGIEGGLAILPLSMVMALVIGLVVTVLSALIPARRAGRVPPVAAMRDVAIDRTGRSLIRLILGGVLMLLGLGLGSVGAVDHRPATVGLGVGLGFVGVLFAASAIARPVGRVVGWPLARFRGVSGMLARNNAVRNPRRTAATGLALTIGIGIVAFFLVLNASLRSSLDKVIDENFRGDFIVEGSSGGFLAVSSDLAPDVEDLSEVDRVTSVRFAEARIDDSEQFLLGASPSLYDAFGFGTSGSTGMDPGEVVVRQAAAESEGLSEGDELTMEFLNTDEPVTLTVAGFYEEVPGLQLGDYVVGLEELEAHVPSAGDNMVVIELAEGADADAARSEIAALIDTHAPGAEVQDNEDYKESLSAELDGVLQMILVLLALAIVIAAFGIANTIALSTMERTRELGLLRAVGMVRRQLRAMVRWESIIIALYGAGLGLTVGILGGWGLVTSLADEGLEVFTLPLLQLAILAVVAALVGLGAALWPAWRAGRLDVLRAIHTE